MSSPESHHEHERPEMPKRIPLTRAQERQFKTDGVIVNAGDGTSIHEATDGKHYRIKNEGSTEANARFGVEDEINDVIRGKQNALATGLYRLDKTGTYDGEDVRIRPAPTSKAFVDRLAASNVAVEDEINNTIPVKQDALATGLYRLDKTGTYDGEDVRIRPAPTSKAFVDRLAASNVAVDYFGVGKGEEYTARLALTKAEQKAIDAHAEAINASIDARNQALAEGKNIGEAQAIGAEVYKAHDTARLALTKAEQKAIDAHAEAINASIDARNQALAEGKNIGEAQAIGAEVYKAHDKMRSIELVNAYDPDRPRIDRPKPPKVDTTEPPESYKKGDLGGAQQPADPTEPIRPYKGGDFGGPQQPTDSRKRPLGNTSNPKNRANNHRAQSNSEQGGGSAPSNTKSAEPESGSPSKPEDQTNDSNEQLSSREKQNLITTWFRKVGRDVIITAITLKGLKDNGVFQDEFRRAGVIQAMEKSTKFMRDTPKEFRAALQTMKLTGKYLTSAWEERKTEAWHKKSIRLQEMLQKKHINKAENQRIANQRVANILAHLNEGRSAT